YGSRTARMFIWHGANMGLFLRWGNWAVAKMMEFLFNATNLTDVGCTMRLISRPALEVIQPTFRIGGSAFGPEMILLSLISGRRGAGLQRLRHQVRPRTGRAAALRERGRVGRRRACSGPL